MEGKVEKAPADWRKCPDGERYDNPGGCVVLTLVEGGYWCEVCSRSVRVMRRRASFDGSPLEDWKICEESECECPEYAYGGPDGETLCGECDGEIRYERDMANKVPA